MRFVASAAPLLPCTSLSGSFRLPTFRPGWSRIHPAIVAAQWGSRRTCALALQSTILCLLVAPWLTVACRRLLSRRAPRESPLWPASFVPVHRAPPVRVPPPLPPFFYCTCGQCSPGLPTNEPPHKVCSMSTRALHTTPSHLHMPPSTAWRRCTPTQCRHACRWHL